MKKKIFYSKIFTIFLFFPLHFLQASIENKIVANVGNEIVSSYELKNKIKTIVFLSKQELNQKNINLAKEKAIRSLIDTKIKKQELNKYKIKMEDEPNSNMFIKNVSSQLGTDINGLRKIFSDNNLDFEIYSKELMIEFSWQKLIFSLYKNKINLNEEELEKELSKIVRDNKNIKEYQLAEIELPFLNSPKDQENINEIYDQIKEIGFKNTAIKFSSSTSAFDGGNLGWISSKSLSANIFNIVEKMKIGNISKPIQQTNTFLILKLMDERMININKLNIEEMRKKIINTKRNEFLNLFSNSHLSKLKSNTLIKIR